MTTLKDTIASGNGHYWTKSILNIGDYEWNIEFPVNGSDLIISAFNRVLCEDFRQEFNNYNINFKSYNKITYDLKTIYNILHDRFNHNNINFTVDRITNERPIMNLSIKSSNDIINIQIPMEDKWITIQNITENITNEIINNKIITFEKKLTNMEQQITNMGNIIANMENNICSLMTKYKKRDKQNKIDPLWKTYKNIQDIKISFNNDNYYINNKIIKHFKYDYLKYLSKIKNLTLENLPIDNLDYLPLQKLKTTLQNIELINMTQLNDIKKLSKYSKTITSIKFINECNVKNLYILNELPNLKYIQVPTGTNTEVIKKDAQFDIRVI